MNEDEQTPTLVKGKRIRRKKGYIGVSDEVTSHVIVLRRNGLTYQRIADKLGLAVSTVAKVCLQNTYLTISDKDTNRILEQLDCEKQEQEESSTDALSVGKAVNALVTKYAAKGEYDWLPLYFTRTHQVSHLIAKQVSVQLKQLKESLANKGKKK